MSDVHRSAKFFNTAIIATKLPAPSNYSERLRELLASDAFQVIMASICEHAATKNISEQDAAQEIIKMFRELDELWDQFIFHEGIERLKAMLSS